MRTRPTRRSSSSPSPSKTRSPGPVYEAVSTIVQQKIAQVEGVGDVELGGGSLPAVRVELLPFALNKFDCRARRARGDPGRPRRTVRKAPRGRRAALADLHRDNTPTGGRTSHRLPRLVVAWRDGAAVRLGDIANVYDGVEDTRTLGLFNGEPAVIVLVTRRPDANVIETVDAVRALLPELQAQLPQDVELRVATDRTHSIRASLREIEITLMISVVLVVLVVSAFLRSARAT